VAITRGAELDESIPPLVIDKQRMREALVNLVKNAIEAAGTHGAEFDESTQRGYIRCATKMNGERVLLSVTDNGPGISSCNLTRVFDPYWTTKADGSGLGLTLVFKVIQAHNGEITVHSSPGEGACFLISLPAPGGDIKMLETNSGQ
jgi:signal transduction histidine kinase